MVPSKINKSSNCKKSAELLERNRLYSCAANRFYYSLFQLIYAWALHEKFLTPATEGKHGVLRQFLTGKIKNDLNLRKASLTFKKMRGLRETADYERENISSVDLDRLREEYKASWNFLLKIVKGL